MAQEYVDIELAIDPEEYRQGAYERMQVHAPAWEPYPANPETWLIDALSEQNADLAALVVDASAAIFRSFGEQLFSVVPVRAVEATATTTWTMVDNAGYTIPEGTLVGVAATGSQTIGFVTAAELIVAPGATTGEVTITAVEPGTEANDLTADPTLIDSLSFVSSISLDTTTADGLDEEDPDEYADRLRSTLSLLTDTPVLPEDAAAIAQLVTGVYRATAIDNYDPGDSSYDNERMVTVAVVDEDGAAVSSGIKDAVEALLEAKRETNFTFHVIDPTFTSIKVDVDAVAYPGNDAAAVDAEIVTAIEAFLSPATWGNSPRDVRAWRNQTTVRRNDLIALVDSIDSVDYVSALTLSTEAGVLGTADVTLTGAAPLPTPGTITCDVS
jgi:hypothetical protein